MIGFRPQPGAEFTLGNKWYVVSTYDARQGVLILSDSDGVLTTMPLEEVVNHPRLHIDTNQIAALDLVALLPPDERETVLRRIGHVNEVVTGYRSGDPTHALPCEPKPQYDPTSNLKAARFAAKEAELDNEFARNAGEYMSISTMRRLAKAIDLGIAFEKGVDGRTRRRSRGRRRMPSDIAEETHKVVEEQRDKSNLSIRGMYGRVKQRILATHPEEWVEVNFPSEDTFRRFLKDHYTPSELNGKARTRASSTEAPETGFHRTNPTRPGELVFMDTNSLDVLLKGTALEGLVNGSLIVALDCFSRSAVAVRIVEKAEKDIDVGYALLDIARPKQMMPGWPAETRWPFVGIPEHLIPAVGTAGTEISGMPFVTPEALGLDHGGPYKSQKTRELATRYHVDILPARVRTGSDKSFIERFFGALVSMLLDKLGGYRGSDVSERGANIADDVEWTAQSLEDLISQWVVLIWQTHIMDGVRPPWCPEGEWSPNALYQHGLSTSGLVPRLMTSDDYFGVMHSTQCTVRSRGVKVLGLWYDNDPDGDDPTFLDALRNKPSPYANNKWSVHYDRRDLRQVYLVDVHKERHLLKWTGATGEVPCFNDRHVQALRRRIAADGLKPKHDSEILEILINHILPKYDPKKGWTTSGTADGKETKAAAAASKALRDEQLSHSDAANYGVEPPTAQRTGSREDVATEAVRANRNDRRKAAEIDEVQPAARLGTTRVNLLGNLALQPDPEEES